MMETHVDCNGNYGLPIFDSLTYRDVIDDHVPAHNAGIPAINLIDINFGENASDFGGYWHTHQDTADKVSAESLGLIGNILELGLMSSAWIIEYPADDSEISSQESIVQETLEEDDISSQTVEKSRLVGYIAIVIVALILILILMADISLKL